jgi:hypothetical protein
MLEYKTINKVFNYYYLPKMIITENKNMNLLLHKTFVRCCRGNEQAKHGLINSYSLQFLCQCAYWHK